MNTAPKHSSRRRNRLMAAAASVAIAGAVGFGAVTTGTMPVFAEAVTVTAPQVPSFADVVERVSPAVVSVRVKANVQNTADRNTGTFFFGPDNLPDNPQLRRFFEQFREFGNRDRGPHHRNRADRPRPVAQGSGFFISEDGYLVTNNHVVKEGGTFTVVMDDGAELDAKLVGADPRTDLAVLKVDADNRTFTYVDFADDSKVRVGDWVVAVGNPFGLGGTVTAGIISARGRDIGAGPYDDFIQIDAAVNRGNSGGPAFDLSGRVVGINTAIFSPSGGNVGIAFAIPASTAKTIVGELIENGAIARDWLGVEIQPVTKDIAESLGMDEDKGALVARAQDDSPARKAGIVAGDVITQVDGKDVASTKDLARMIAAYDPGSSVGLTVLHAGKTETVTVELGEMPTNERVASADRQEPSKPGTLADLGLIVTGSDDGRGLVVTDVDPDSEAANRGIQAGDIITQVNSQEVNSVRDVTGALEEAAKAGRKSVLVQISRNDSHRFVALPIERG